MEGMDARRMRSHAHCASSRQRFSALAPGACDGARRPFALGRLAAFGNRFAAMASALGSLSVLAGCGSGGEEAPAPAPVRPTATLSGVVAGPLSDASVWVHALSDGEAGAQLSERAAGTDAEGRFSLSLSAPDQLVLLVASGGRFSEWASARSVALGPNDGLRAVAAFRSGESMEVNVSALTHWVAACVASGRHGPASAQALAECAGSARQIFGAPVLQAPASPSDPNLAGAGWEREGLRYGFVLAGISELMATVSERNRVEPHRFYTSVRFADALYRDMRADGLLDGQDQGGQLAFGVVAVDAALYRRDLGLGTLAALSSPRNRTAATVASALADVRAVAESGHAVFGDAPAEALDATGPVIEPALPEGAQVSGMLAYALRISDASGVERVEVRLGQTQRVLSGTTPVFTVDTRALEDGAHRIAARAYDILGNFTERAFTVQVRNHGPALRLDAEGATHTRQARHVVSGAVTGAVAVVAVTVDGRAADLDESGRFSGEAALAEGDNRVTVEATDALGNASSRTARVTLDTRGPVFSFLGATVVYWDETQPYQGGFGADGDDSAQALHMPASVFEADVAAPAELAARNLPHYRFSVSDRGAGGDAPGYTPAGELAVGFRYRLGGSQPLDSGWQAMPTHAELGPGEHALALNAARMPSGWHNAELADLHTVDFRALDRAGNATLATRRFRARFMLNQVAVRSQLAGAEARLFAYQPGSALPGGVLGHCRTDAAGRCALALLAEPQTVYLKVSGGALTEWASGQTVRLEPTQGLLSVADYPGGDVRYSNTVFSHLQTALLMKLAERDAAGALPESARRFVSVYGIEPVSTAFADVRERANDAGTLSPALRYGYLLAGVSEATLRISEASRDVDHSRYHSYWFADTQWRDLRDDGRADGLDDTGSIMRGADSVGVDAWRFALARGMLDFLQRGAHALSFNPEDLLPAANGLAGSQDAMFAGQAGALADIAPPRIEVDWPASDPLAGLQTARFSLQDANALSVRAALDGRPWELTHAGDEARVEIDTRGLADGAHRLEIEAVDAQGNTASWQRQFVSDNTTPSIAVTARPDARWLRGEARFAFALVDAHLSAVTLRVDGLVRERAGTLAAPELALDTTALSDGPHQLSVSAQDAAGHIAETVLAMDVDNHPPVIVLSAPQRAWHSGALSVNFTVRDAHPATLTVSVDGQLAAYTGTPSGGAVLIDTSELADGEHAVTVQAQDLPAAASSATWRFRTDNQPPSVSLDVRAARSRGERVAGAVDFRFAVSDATLALVELRLDGARRAHGADDAAPALSLDTATLADGVHHLELVAADRLAHVTRHSHRFVVDNTPPIVDPIVVPVSPLLSGVAQFAFVLIDSSLDAVAVDVDGMPLDHGERDERPRLALDSAALADGWHALTLRASDDLALASSWTYMLQSDNHPPLIALRSVVGAVGEGRLPLLSGAVELAFELADESLASVQARLDGEIVAHRGPLASPLVTVDAEALSAGAHELVLLATDGFGRASRFAYPFRVDDGTAPIAPLSVPAGFWTDEELRLTLRIGESVSGSVSVALDDRPLAPDAISRLVERLSLRVDVAMLAEGRHQLTLKAVDVLGHALAWRYDFGVDQRAPALRLEAVAGIWSGVVDLAFVVEDASPTSLTVSVDGVALALGDAASLALDTAALVEGAHVLRLSAVDALGRSATLTHAFVSDNRAPLITPRFAELERLHGTVSLDFEISDPHLEAVLVTLDENPLSHQAQGSTHTLEMDTVAMADGAHALLVRARDSLGHSTTWRAAFLVDNSAPGIEAVVPPPGVALSGIATLLFLISDHALGEVRVSLDGEPLPYQGGARRPRVALDTTALVDGMYELRVEAVNLPGYRSVWQRSFVVDNHPPRIDPVSAPSADAVSATVRFAFSVSDASLQSTTLSVDGVPVRHDGGMRAPSLRLDTTRLADGPHRLDIQAVDLNRRVTSLRYRFHVDNVPPVIAVTAPSASALSATARFDFVVMDVALVSVDLSLDGRALAFSGSRHAGSLLLDTATLADGAHRLRLLARDAIGHESVWEETITTDNRAPLIVPDQEVAAVLSGVVSLTWTVHDATLSTTLLLLDDADIAFDGGARHPGMRLDTTQIREGSHSLSVVAVDALGRTARWRHDFIADHAAPRIRALSGTLRENALLHGDAVLAFAVDDASLVTASLSVDGRRVDHGGYAATPTLSLDTATLADGAHRIRVSATDALGQESSRLWTVSVDNAPPVVRMLSVLDAWLSGALALSLAVDDAQLSTLRLTLDGAPLDWQGSAANPQLALDTAMLADGQHALVALARDRLGRETRAEWLLRTDNAAPRIRALSGTLRENALLHGDVVLAFAVDDASLVTASLSVDGRRVDHGGYAATPTLSLDTATLADGAHRIRVSATDALGRESSRLWTVSVDNAPPVIAVTAPSAAALSATARFDFVVMDVALVSVDLSLDGRALAFSGSRHAGSLLLDTATLADGTHRLRLLARDAIGHESVWEETITTDNRAPLIVPDQEVAAVLSGVVSLTWTVHDATLSTTLLLLDDADIAFDGGARHPGMRLDTTQIREGSHSLSVVAVDALGRTARWRHDFIADHAAPRIRALSGTLRENALLHGDVVLAFAVDDASLVTASLSVDGRRVDHGGYAATPTLSLDTATLADGAHRIRVSATDALGRESSRLWTVSVDNAPPVIAVTAPSAAALSATARFDFVVMDVALVSVDLSLDGRALAFSGSRHAGSLLLDTATLADGAHRLRLLARDAIGHESVWEETITTDNRAPLIVPDQEVAAVLSGVVSLTWTVHDATLSTTLLLLDDADIAFDGGARHPGMRLDTTQIREGSHSLSVVAVDVLGRTARWRHDFIADHAAPRIRALSGTLRENALLHGDVVLAFAVDDASLVTASLSVDGRRVDHGGYAATPTLSLDTATLADGAHRIRVSATDALGQESSRLWTVSVDNAPPVVRMLSVLDAWLSGALALSLAVDDAQLSTLRLTLDGAPLDWQGSAANPQLALDTAMLADGAHALVALARDRLGRETRAEWLLRTDNAAPRVTALAQPACCPFVDSIEARWSVVDVSLDAVTLRLDGQVVDHGDDDSAPSLSLDAGALADGAHALSLVAIDALGREGGHTLDFQVDNSSPTIRLLSSPGDWLSGRVLFEYQVSDAFLASLRFALDETDLAHSGTDGAPYLQLDTARHSEGRHSLRVFASDAAGNHSVHSLDFGIDNSAPVVTVDLTREWTRGTVSATVTVTDAALRAVPELSLDGERLPSPTASWRGERATIDIDTTRLRDGAHRLAVLATDVLGRTSAASAELLVDNHAPSIRYALNGARGARGWLHGAQVLDYSAQDVALQALSVFLDEREIAAGLPGAGEWTLHTATMSDGVHRVRLHATDAIGHSHSEAFDLPVDNTPPVIEPRIGDAAWRPDSTSTFAGAKTLRFALDNAGAGAASLFARMRLRAADGAETLLAESAGRAEIRHVLRSAEYADGAYQLLVDAEDGAGHRSEAGYALRFDNSAPRAVALFDTGPDSPWRGGVVNLDFTITDATSARAVLTANARALEPAAPLPEGAMATLRFALDSALDADGYQNLALRLSDGLGNVAVERYVIRVDNTPPHLLYQIEGTTERRAPYNLLFVTYAVSGRLLSEVADTVRVVHWPYHGYGPDSQFFSLDNVAVPVSEDGSFAFSFSLLGCCAEEAVYVQVFDQVGNVTEIRDSHAQALEQVNALAIGTTRIVP